MHALIRASLASCSTISYHWPDTFLALSQLAPFPSRTHTCGGLSARDAGSRVILTGWLLPERKGKLVSFFPLKDSFGTVQLIVNNSDGTREDLAALSKVPTESSVLVEGQVLLRPPSARRPSSKGPTGEIDVQVDNFILLNTAASDLPFMPSNVHNLPSEDIRLRYRYLDLRRSVLSDNLQKRSRVAHLVRNILHDSVMLYIGFVEIETPILLRSSPEGAREFLVPTRTKSASDFPAFYALQQSPQQPKQLLIASGTVDKYFQIAKCFRDEDGRKDRQPEFTQIDLEMAYVSWGTQCSGNWRIGGSEVRVVVETIIKKIWKNIENVDLPSRFPVMTYNEAMTRFGSDKPDTRFGLEITEITPFVTPTQKRLLDEKDEILEAIIIRRSQEPGFWENTCRCELDSLVESISITEKNAVIWLQQSKTIQVPASSEVIESQCADINAELSISAGDIVWLARRSRVPSGGSTLLGRQRLRLLDVASAAGKVTLPEAPQFLWVTEFPLFTRFDDDKEFLAKGRYSSSHHPFTAPMWEDIKSLYEDKVESVRGQHYDLVLNGVEIGGGSVRVHDASMQDHIFSNVLQLSEQEKAPFDQLLHALRCGAPPHGGIALGFDRLMSILCKTQSIRDVIAFPKTAGGTDLLFKSPAMVPVNVLAPYGIQFQNPDKTSSSSS
ncbi:tRNA synthetases class II-domain-containing protein [Lentinula aff. detonsa]|uniref:tRNA synthetases class II-domain-containing protein n=1 Tax=Lentinula aff. detonsa TaxID=2804958 RepID=A0AA38NSZ1_9AGAR|nr:tRNA synthetases class II-domain-containing protein [Lentinula aff. detonsa]